MPTALSEFLLQDLRVIEARSTILDLGSGAAASFAVTRRATLLLALDGIAELEVGKSAAVLRLEPGDSVLLFYGDAHELRASGEGAARRVQVPERRVFQDVPPTLLIGAEPVRGSVLSSILELAYVSPSAFANRAAPDFFHMRKDADQTGGSRPLSLDLTQLRRACAEAGGTAFSTSLAALLLVHMMRAIYDGIWQSREVDVTAPNTRRVSAAIREIHAHLDRDWTVASLAQEVGLSRTAFAEVFRSAVGMTPLAYVADLRMRRAAELLGVDAISSREVAERVGYRLESSFARAFKKHYGLPPQQFAARSRNPA